MLERDKVKNLEMKSILKAEYFRRTRKILKSSLNAGNIIQAINSRAASAIRYGAGIVEWTKLEPQEIYRSMHPQADVTLPVLEKIRRREGIAECGGNSASRRDKLGGLPKR